jgi:RsmE family RNA methyltransferase
MNIVLFEEYELAGDRLVLSGRRADHIRSVLRLDRGDSLRVGRVNGPMGRAEILAWQGNDVELRVDLDREPPPAARVELILALPRPIMVQRILKQATVLGIERLHLIRSARVEKSFFHSPVLQEGKIRELLLQGLEQAVDTRLPEVFIHHRFRPFVEDVVPTLQGCGILAHPGVEKTLPVVFARCGDPVPRILLAVGPEGGWNDFELECFIRQKFQPFTMGSRILHVDTAVTALLAQLRLLLDIQGAGK